MTQTISTLSNGMTVVTDAMPHLESASIGVWVNAGARHETAGEHGLAHMLEHMAFKGTATRSAREIAEAIERVGGYLNAYTAREQTAYYARVLKADVPLALEIIGDILLHSVFDQTELERERGVIIQEIGEAEDTPDDVVFDHLNAAIYESQPLGRSILGTVQSVSGFGPQALKAYMAKHYLAGSMIVVAAGAVQHDKVAAQAERLFSNLPRGQGLAAERSSYRGGERRVTDELEQVHLAMAWPGVSLDSQDNFVSQIFASTLGGGMSSRLFQEAREKRGLCYSIYAYSQHYRDGGIMGIYAGTSEEQAGELLDVVARETLALSQSATDAEVARARAQAKAGVLMALESPSARCEQIAGQLLAFGRLMPVSEVIERIESVDARAVRRFGASMLSAGHLSLAALGPVSRVPDYDALRRRFH